MSSLCSTNPSVDALLRHAAQTCAEIKAIDPIALDVQGLSDISDYLLLVSGRSDRQVQGISNRVLEAFAAQGIHPVSVEGLEKGHWVVLDFGAIIVHVFYEPVRALYDLEGLWSRAPRIPLAAAASKNTGRARQGVAA
jgi:ribosome-associated protein